MNIEDMLEVVGLVASFTGFLIAVLSLRQGKRLVAISGLLAVGLISTAILFSRSKLEGRRIAQIEIEIVESLASRSLTFDELHIQLLFRTYPDVKNALFRLIKNGSIHHCLNRTQINGKLVSYRVYYIPIHERISQLDNQVWRQNQTLERPFCQ